MPVSWTVSDRGGLRLTVADPKANFMQSSTIQNLGFGKLPVLQQLLLYQVYP
jgi:hypothetical protein